MAGLYIHIPFCASRCIYCGFYSTTALSLHQQYVDAVCKELESRGGFFPLISTIYLGGGTPSQLSITQLKQLFDTIYIYNKVSPDAEVTIECNPDDVTPAFAKGLRTLPVNRVSMGAQTFDDRRLHFLQRRHTALQVSEATTLLREAGIRNISIDLMYGFPGENLEQWQHDIEAAIALGVEHISAYCLMIEEGTPLHRLLTTGQRAGINDLRLPPFPSEEDERAMYETLADRLEAAGYEHYEISNFARPGYRSRHNSSYWDGAPYLGIGAAAHSYDLTTRRWNVSDIRQYIEGINSSHPGFEQEQIDEDTHYNDIVTTALRTREGIDLTTLTPRHRAYCIKEARRFINDGLLSLSPDSSHLHLTRQGLFVSDMVMRELIFA